MPWKLNLQFAICNYQFAIIFALVFSPAAAALAAPPLAVPIEGKPYPAELVSIEQDETLVFAVDGKTNRLPPADLVFWGAPVEPRRGPLVVSADGGLLAADVLSADKDRLEVDSELFGRLKLPLEKLAGVIFRLPGAVRLRDRLLDRLAAAAGEGDRLLLENGDELTGALDGIDEKTANLQTEAGPANVELARVDAAIFNPQLKSKPDAKSPRVWLGFSDGSRMLAKTLSMDEKNLHFTVFGQTVKTAAKNLVFMQLLSGRAAYLSDFKPREYRHVPYLSIAWPYQNDRNVEGGFLRAAGRLHLKGIGMHSAARLSYDLPGGTRRFQAEAAIDDAAAGEGSVRFRVFVDGKERYTSPTVRGGAAPLPIDVEVSGGKRLDLVVDFADRADVQDRADWLDARLIMERAKQTER
ncbi:MAG: NPCBM/NEW2 domain-containing protein [Pirellulales bacterium]|nr:NPCBM/NEW2 domain-containing protein [Pirellulales bacterium]